MAYDYGVMRDCWLIALHDRLDGRRRLAGLARAAEIRKFNYIGDSHIFTGEVVDKRSEDGRCVVDIEMRGTNQRDTVTCPGKATVALPEPRARPGPPARAAGRSAGPGRAMLERHHEIVAERKSEGRGRGVNPGQTGLAAEVQAWVDANWDTWITVREWWRRLAEAGYAYPRWPEGLGGLGRVTTRRRDHRRRAGRRTGSSARRSGHVAATLAAPTLLEHGDAEQVAGSCADRAPARRPGASSSASPARAPTWPASAPARCATATSGWSPARRCGTPARTLADFGMLLARTDADLPKHAGPHLLRHRHAPARRSRRGRSGR